MLHQETGLIVKRLICTLLSPVMTLWFVSPPRSDLRGESNNADGFGAREKDKTVTSSRDINGLAEKI
jgi:hypothetical protein